MDEEGFVYIVDRLKDMIITGGENVYSVEVENAVYQHPSVAECAVIGVPDDKWGERVHAIVRLKDSASLTTEALIEHCRGLLPGSNARAQSSFEKYPTGQWCGENPKDGTAQTVLARQRSPCELIRKR